MCHSFDLILMAINMNTAPKNGRKATLELKLEKLNPVAEPKTPSLGSIIPLITFKSFGIDDKPETKAFEKLEVALCVSSSENAVGRSKNEANKQPEQ